MHDLNFFRTHLEQVRDRLATRGFALDVEAFQELDKQRRQCVTASEQLKAERNKATAEIGKLRKEGLDTAGRQEQVRAIGNRIAELDQQVSKVEGGFRDFLSRIPNLPHESVPV